MGVWMAASVCCAGLMVLLLMVVTLGGPRHDKVIQ